MRGEDFEVWLKDPVTQWVFRAAKKAAAQEKAEWMRLSWETGQSDPAALLELRTRASALTELCDNDFETWQEWIAND